ncbi:chromatin binding FHA domain protein Tos4 [Schizosaccharomyces osmophilus]|uniref:Chromatin binding FHA domain protein Tos4 n=1 Tax=Schizosaccharomyces osmophilus TaxID=2545709 RepID=A0AAF0AV15_9SCHI|nr:chromatin binding FHA domain protein Tos4 [Schizosaccharomyces osmophilus]WBW73096.1 chromatin binding FHA domain protein Tos4 [Schizosaccharomyces osmophilus]
MASVTENEFSLPSPISSSPSPFHKKSWMSKHPNGSLNVGKPPLGQFVLTPEPSSNTFYQPSSPISAVKREPLTPMSYVKMNVSRVIKIGRSTQQCDHVLSIADKAISRVHAVVICTLDRMIVECVGWNGMILTDSLRKAVYHMKKNDRVVLFRPGLDSCPILDVFGYRMLLGWPEDPFDTEGENSEYDDAANENEAPMSPSTRGHLPLLPSSPPQEIGADPELFAAQALTKARFKDIANTSTEENEPARKQRVLERLIEVGMEEDKKANVHAAEEIDMSMMNESTAKMEENDSYLKPNLSTESYSCDPNHEQQDIQVYQDEEGSNGEFYNNVVPTPEEPIVVRHDSMDESAEGLANRKHLKNLIANREMEENQEPPTAILPSSPYNDDENANTMTPNSYNEVKADPTTCLQENGYANEPSENYVESSKENSAPESLLMGLILDELVFSTTSTTALTVLAHLFPSGMPLAAVQDHLRELAKQYSYLKEVRRFGTDANGDPLWSQWYYNPEEDDDEERRQRYAPIMRPVRSSRRVHKQYFWKKPRTRVRSSNHSSRKRRLA